MLALIKNEAYKMFKTKKIFVFMLVIFIYNLFPALEQVVGAIDESQIIINGQTTPFYMLNFFLTNILPIFMIVSLADMITGEYVSGTLKMPLLQPVSRTKLLAAKTLALVFVLASLLIFSLILSYVMGTLIFGWGEQFSFQEPEQAIQEATVYSTTEGIMVTVASYLVSIIPLIAFGMIILFLALLFNSSGVTVGISIGFFIFLSILGEAVVAARPYLILNGFQMFKFLFVSQDINSFISTFIMTFIYGAGFFLASILLFKKKDLLH